MNTSHQLSQNKVITSDYIPGRSDQSFMSQIFLDSRNMQSLHSVQIPDVPMSVKMLHLLYWPENQLANISTFLHT